MRSGETHPIKDFLARYKERLRPPQGTVIQAFCAAAAAHNIPLDPKNVSYTPHTKTIAVRHSGPLKSEILIRKQELLLHCKNALGPQNAPEHVV